MKLLQTILDKFSTGLFLALWFLALPLICAAQTGKIAFVTGGSEVYKMNRNGSGITNLTNNPARDEDPFLSSDGTRIVFTSYRDNNDPEIYIMNDDGSGQTRLTFNQGTDIQPAFSKDGEKIVFVSRRNLMTTLFLMDANGNNQIAWPAGAGPLDPSFSPDGSKIVLSTISGGTADRNIWMVDPNTSMLTQLTHVEPATAFWPSFSPDGTTIVFWSSEGGGKICIVSSAGGSHSSIANSTTQNAHPTFSPDGSKIVFTKVVNGLAEVWAMDADGSNQNRLSFGIEPSWGGAARKPVMIVPGIAGTFSSSIAFDTTWLLNRGVLPAGLQIDPFAHVYDDLIQTFENLGYVKNKDLFIVNYDWRLPSGPLDSSINGIVSGISGTSISDQQFEYGVDYLGVALRRACERWEQDHPGRALDEVDVIAHSTGGLVARTYIQSPAYNATFTAGKKLPMVRNLLMVGVPNRGASKAWNPINDNWNVEKPYRLFLSKIIDRAYQKVLSGHSISGPDHTITRASILDSQGNPSHEKFINQYVPTMRALLATYDFADFGSGYTNVNGDPDFSNDWILDLNDGYDYVSTADPSPFANNCAPTVIYTDNQPTPTSVKEIRTGGTDAVLNFDQYLASDVPVDRPWFMEIPGLNGGDGTVPVKSAIGQFTGDNRVTLTKITAGNPDHTKLMSNVAAQKAMLQTIGVPFQDSNIHFGFAVDQGALALEVTFDPVDGFLIDGAGRRLGFSESTGPITEIPGSVWFGDADGMGWVFGPVQEPLRLELTGRGEPYYVIVSVETDHGNGGVVDSGILGLGAQRGLPIVIGPATANQAPDAVDDNATTNQDTPITIAVLANDSDPDGDPLTIANLSSANNGTLAINPDNTVTYSPVSGFAGADTFTYTISDGRGGSDTATVTVTISLSNRSPNAVCQNITRFAGANCQATVSAQEVDGGSSDPDGDAITLALTPTGPFAVGSHSVTLTVTDSHGASSTCSSTLTVIDNTPPVVNCPSNIVIDAPAGQCAAAVTYSASATDNCGGATVICTPPSGSTFRVGATVVSCVGRDASNNTANCSFSVTVNDTQPPTISCPPNLSVTVATGATSSVVNYTQPMGNDNCSGTTTVCVPSSGSTFPVGVTTVICRATDASSNTAQCSFTVTVTAAPAAADRIAFESNRDGNFEIYTMNADGINSTRLTFNPQSDISPAWSPDRTKIAFTSTRDGNPEIYVMNADGTNQTRLTSTSAIEDDPSWSPDGTKIAFWSMRDGNPEIYVMNANGTNQTRVTSNSRSDTQPQWSPDGTKLVFVSNRDSLLNFDVYVMNANGSNVTRLTTNQSVDESPDWSPDGTKIVFTSNRSNLLDFEIWVMNANGSNQTRLTTSTRSSVRPTWSGDGTKITFATNRDSLLNFEIYTMDANGSSQTRITTNSAIDFNPDR